MGSMRAAAMLWTGGKDCALAMYEAASGGYDVRCLVTFAPPEPKFLAHPLSVMKLQAEAMGLPHIVHTIREPWDEGYEKALRQLRASARIDGVITGDIAEVDGMPNWILERTRAISMHAHMPLWGRDRETLLRRLVQAGFRAIVCCVDTRRLDAGWVGRALDEAAVAELRRLGSSNGLDLCGENGEYHTLVVDGPLFERPIEICTSTMRMAGALAYLDPCMPPLAGAAA